MKVYNTMPLRNQHQTARNSLVGWAFSFGFSKEPGLYKSSDAPFILIPEERAYFTSINYTSPEDLKEYVNKNRQN